MTHGMQSKRITLKKIRKRADVEMKQLRLFLLMI